MKWAGTTALLLVVACGPEPATDTFLTRDELLDPEACKTCHEDHYREWSGSMHAYAAEDPVFLAMNARGQRETGGELGDFCVGCHAPMAVREGYTTDGLNMDEVPQHLQGVTCFFCHSVDGVEGTHNNPLHLASDGVMRGGISNPVSNTAHASAYSPLMDREELASADVCGSCHDIVLDNGVELERTYQEWKGTLFSNEMVEQRLTCGGCHTDGRDGLAANAPGVYLRRVHSHAMPGVDVAISPFPEMEEQRRLVQVSLNTTVLASLCVARDGEEFVATVDLENVAAGHSWPSGATQDRRAWVELIAFAGEEVVFQTGVVADDEALAGLNDPNLFQFRDHLYNADGEEVHMFWEAVSSESELLRGPDKLHDPDSTASHAIREYRMDRQPTRITMRVRIRPMGLDLMDDLIASGDLEPKYRSEIVTFSLAATELEWTTDSEGGCAE
jgi:hypothetical protein